MRNVIQETVDLVGQVVLGKERQIKLAIACLLSEGHLLIEDMPGMGKTTLAHALGKVFNLSYNRIQFTSDILPADIIGAQVFDKQTGQFVFHQGPIFNQLILADEINRTTPKSQSALLEAMEERQVTVDGDSRPLPEPFFVIATQNPIHQSGTYPLPESQLDRFLMRIELGYPDPVAERHMFTRDAREISAEDLHACLPIEHIQSIRTQVDKVHASGNFLDYLQRLVAYTRNAAEFSFGLSPRGALALLQCARTWALMSGREHLVPEDLQKVLPSVAAHRLVPASDYAGDSNTLIRDMLTNVDVIPG
jgi:MoxR-like ATPase